MNHLLLGFVFYSVGVYGGELSDNLSGKWKLVGTLPGAPVGQDSILVLLDINKKKEDCKIISTGISAFNGTKSVVVSLTGKFLNLSLQGPVPLDCVFKIPEESGTRIPGAFNLQGNWFPCALEKSTSKTLHQEKLDQASPGSDLVEKLRKMKTVAEKIQITREIIQKHPASPAALVASAILFDQAIDDSNDENLKISLELLNDSTRFYPYQILIEYKKKPIFAMCRKNRFPELALQLLEELKAEMVGSPSLVWSRTILKIESEIYPLIGKNQLGKEALVKLGIIEKELDAEFEKDAVPFAVEKTVLSGFSPRSPAVLELFTGAQCPPCVSAEVAFNGLRKSCTQGDLILLQYHLHIPGPDPLTNSYSEARARYYGVNSTPTVFLNGLKGPSVGGPKGAAAHSYGALINSLSGISRKKEHASINLELICSQEGEGSSVLVKYRGLSNFRNTLLRIILAEEVVRYPGRNGQRLHHQVVRGPVGDSKGYMLEAAQGHHTVRFNTADVRKQIENYWEEFQKRRPFLDDERPLDLTKLVLVALLQDIDSKEVIQAVRVPFE